MQDYSSDEWPTTAAGNGLDSFESIWALDIGWFEEPNIRRGGWSGVSRMEVMLADGRHEGIFIKRQQNHVTRTWRYPLRGITTFRREFENLMKLMSFGVPTLEVLYFADRQVNDDRRSILISRELEGYSSFENCMTYWSRHGMPDRSVRREIIGRLAAIARHMHSHRMQHNSFLPKHVFIGERDGSMDIRLIDFEKSKFRLTREQAMLRDMDTFNRRAPGLKRTDRLRFLLAYHETDRVNDRVRKTWNRVAALERKKRRNKLASR